MGNAQWLTTIRVISILLLSFVVFFIYSNYQTGKFLSNSGLPSPDPLLSQMRNDLNELEKFSPEYLELYQKINSYERIYKEKLSEATNPDQFYDGLAAIKTNHLGETYSLNDNKNEFIKAKRRKNKAFSTLDWVHRGPFPVSGRARVIVIDKNDPSQNSWFVGSVGGGVWKTSNAGATWVNKTPDFISLSTSTIAQSESNPNVLYVGTGQGYGRTIDLLGTGIWKSTDGGDTWLQLASTANGELFSGINRIVVDPTNPDIVLVCSNNSYTHYGVKEGNRLSGIFRSTDGGNSWIKVFDPDAQFGTATDNRVQQLIAEPGNFNRIYATVNEVGVIYSNNAGLSWSVSNQNMALPADIGFGENATYGGGISTRIELAIARTDINRLYAAIKRPRGIADLYMSKNRGQTWILVNDSGNDPNWFSSNGQSGNQTYQAGWFNNAIIVHPYNKNIVFVGGVNIYRLTINDVANSRTTQRLTGAGLASVHPDHHYFAIARNDANQSFRLLNTNDGGLSYSDDGGINWTSSAGMLTSQLYGIDKKPGENAYIIGIQDNGTWHSGNDPTASSNNWSFDTGGDGVETAWNYLDPNLMMGGSQGGNLVRSKDGGNTWESVFNQNAGVGPFITKIANSKQNPNLIANVGFNGVTLSDDFGDSWTLVTIPQHWLGYRAFDNIEFSLADPQIVWISSRLKTDPILSKTGGIHISKNGGLSFSEISSNLPTTLTESSGIATSPLYPATAFLLFAAKNTPKIMRTTNYGDTWEDISGFSPSSNTSTNGFPNVATFSLLQMPHNIDILWAGTEIGLFISEDNGISWNYADNGLPHVAIFEMKIVDGQIVIATHSNGIYTVDLPELADYQPAEVTLAPVVKDLALHPLGYAAYSVKLKSSFDSSIVRINNIDAVKIGPNSSARDTTLSYLFSETNSVSVDVLSYKDGKPYQSLKKSTPVFNTLSVSSNFKAEFTSPGDSALFYGSQHMISVVNGSNRLALQFPHPYTNATEYIVQLKTPIQILSESSILQYEDIALVEPGDPGSVFGQTEMWDYVVVEGSTDGINWIPVEDGYDSRLRPDWLSAYTNSQLPDESLFFTHHIELLNTFSTGDVIFLRFRLSADAAVTGYGWIIDNISVVGKGNTGATVAEQFILSQNFPNPFNPSTTIRFELKEAARMSLVIYNSLGQKIYTLTDDFVEAGSHEVNWPGINSNGYPVSSGIYFYQLRSGDEIRSKKMTLIR